MRPRWLWALIFFPTLVFANTLELYFYKSPYKLKWSSPRALLLSTLESYLGGEPHPIGHVHVKINCTFLNWQVLTGMTMSDSNSEYDLLIKDQIALGILFYNFNGRLENTDDVSWELYNELAGNRINFLKIKVSGPTCQRLKTYYQEYKQLNYGQNYGLPNRPLYGEGAGCTAFGHSFLEVAGFAKLKFIQDWSRSLKVPEELIGGLGTGRKIDLFEVLFSDYGRGWAGELQEHRKIFFWDPDLMYQWVEDAWFKDLPLEVEYKKITAGNSKGIYLNLEKIPTPTEEIWKY